MNTQNITVTVDCNLSVSRDTAEACLKLVELFINSNKSFGIHDAENDDGTVSLYLIDYENEQES